MLILRLPETKRVMGWRADASQYNAIRDGLFTTGVAIGQRAKGWPDYEVKAIAAARVAGKSDAEIRELVKALHAKRSELAILAWCDSMKYPANEKAPGACNTEGFDTDSAKALNIASLATLSKAFSKGMGGGQ